MVFPRFPISGLCRGTAGSQTLPNFYAWAAQTDFCRSLRNDNKLSRQSNLPFQNFIVMAFPMINSVFGRSSSLPPMPPPQKKNNKFYFCCHLAIFDLSCTKIGSQKCSDHGGSKRARNHSAAEITGFFRFAGGKTIASRWRFLRFASKSQDPRSNHGRKSPEEFSPSWKLRCLGQLRCQVLSLWPATSVALCISVNLTHALFSPLPGDIRQAVAHQPPAADGLVSRSPSVTHVRKNFHAYSAGCISLGHTVLCQSNPGWYGTPGIQFALHGSVVHSGDIQTVSSNASLTKEWSQVSCAFPALPTTSHPRRSQTTQKFHWFILTFCLYSNGACGRLCICPPTLPFAGMNPYHDPSTSHWSWARELSFSSFHFPGQRRSTQSIQHLFQLPDRPFRKQT